MVQVLFVLSWRLGPILALVIIATASTAANYKAQTKAVEKTSSRALAAMVAVADQAFRGITTVRCSNSKAFVTDGRCLHEAWGDI